MFKKFKKVEYNSGMTLIELIVVLAIFAIISGMTMFNYSDFRSTISLQNLSDDVALSIRKAQSFAIGAKGANNSFTDGYGIHFSTDEKYSFVIFADMPDYNNIYDYDNSGSCGLDSLEANNECLELLKINGGDSVSGFMVSSDGTTPQEGDLDITFKRPEPSAIFSLTNENGESVGTSSVDKIGIIISNKNNNQKKIIYVTKAGQISIKNYE